mmetsp:Transcript_73430/g.195083  ORF Transcript_73430/g.195083 Transcript_73430/m.195083 type:complete len:227 (-) Transcript_73430:253-933(-)
MRKRAPSSVNLSKPAAARFRSLPASATSSGRACSCPACEPATVAEGFQEGKRALALSGANAALRKCSFRCSLTAASSCSSERSFSTCSRVASGGTKSSQSSRLSHMLGLNRSLSMALSSSLKAAPERFFQKARPMNSSPPQLPTGASASTSAAWSKSNLSRLRSTPFGMPGAAPGTSRGISARPVRAWIKRCESAGARDMDTFAVGTRPTGTPTRCICPTASSAPP